MQTLKTAVVVVLLLVVFYGVYEMLNRPPGEAPPEVASLDSSATADVDIDLGDFSTDLEPIDSGVPTGSTPRNTTMAIPGTTPPGGASSVGMPNGSPPPNSAFPTPSLPDSSFPKSSAPNAAQPPRGSGIAAAAAHSHAAGESHAAPNSPSSHPTPGSAPPIPPAANTMASGGSIAAAAGAPLVQNNPYVNEPIAGQSTPSHTPAHQLGARAYQADLKVARSLIAQGKYHVALAKLSIFYKSPDLTAEQQRELIDLLDPLAGRVIYSRENLVVQPYKVGRSETLMEIAKKYDVPYQLLQKINGIENPSVLLPGSQLKVVPGPFRAEVDLKTHELTVFLDQLYAGRFPITLGADPPPLEGDFQVRDKRSDKTYFSMDGRTIPATNPANPFGGVWLDLGREVCIHGSPKGGADARRGCISLSPHDAHDVYSILSVGSKIRILR